MMKSLSILIFGFLLLNSYCYCKSDSECLVMYNNVCCKNSCDICSNCSTLNDKDQDCCANIILQKQIYCGENIEPPCIKQSSYLLIKKNTKELTDENSQENSSSKRKTDFDYLSEWLHKLNIYGLIGIICLGCIIVLFILYSCFCFGSKKPPLKLEYVRNRPGNVKIS